MNTSGLRRNFKNIVHNYSDAQVKVREATSNDPWGPSSTLMSEIADYTYNVVAFSEIMQMIWKRLNDHGKNWRHVYKALVLLEYLIKTGTEKVAQQCKENIFAIQTLKDFQYFEENKDHGMNVREKAKQLVALLKDDERLKNERMRALKARERFAQATAGIGSELQNSTLDGEGSLHYQDSYPERISPRNELECARPQTAGEEELQLQLALAMSKEEAEQEEQKRRSDDVRLQMAITQSEEDFSSSVLNQDCRTTGDQRKMREFLKIHDRPMDGVPQKPSNLVDLLDMSVPGPSNSVVATDPWGLPLEQPVPAPRQQSNDPWAPVSSQSPMMSPTASNSWMGRPASSLGVPAKDAFSKPINDPWGVPPPYQDPWGVPVNTSFGSSPSLATNGDLRGLDQLGLGGTTSKSTNNLDAMGGFSLVGTGTPNPFDASGSSTGLASRANTVTKTTPENFLGVNSNLVNLDALISSKPPSQVPGSTNPFAMPSGQAFQPPPPPRVSLNQIRTQQQFGDLQLKNTSDPFVPQMPNPLVPADQPSLLGGGQPVANNPFL